MNCGSVRKLSQSCHRNQRKRREREQGLKCIQRKKMTENF